RIC
ncbi:hypothetical protein CP09DC78_0025B, partial [Chlamydia psittaci 09DC78]